MEIDPENFREVQESQGPLRSDKVFFFNPSFSLGYISILHAKQLCGRIYFSQIL